MGISPSPYSLRELEWMALGKLRTLFDAVGILAVRIRPEWDYKNPFRDPKPAETKPEVIPFDPYRWAGIMQALGTGD